MTSALRRPAVAAFLGTALLACLLGSRCAGPTFPGGPIFPGPGGPGPIIVDTVLIELVNATTAPVDPGLIVDFEEFIVDPPIAPGDSLVLEADCFAGTIIESDATLLTGFGPVASDNIAVVEEGLDFLCGDTVSYIYAEDPAGFFTNVEIIEGF